MEEEEIKKNLLEKSDKIGLFTELEVADTFKNNGFRIELNKYYDDIDEEKGREIDLVAEYCKKTDTDGDDYLEMSFKFIVEIKKSSNPWIFSTFSSDDFHENESPFFRYTSENFDKISLISTFKKHLGEINNQRLGRNFSVLDTSNPKAKSNDSQIIGSLFSVSKAFYEEYFLNNYIKENEGKLSEKIFEYYELLVVVDAPIYEIFVNNEGKEISQVNEVLVSFNYKSPKYNNTSIYFIRVLNKDYLNQFLKERVGSFKKISEEILAKEGDGKPFVD